MDLMLILGGAVGLILCIPLALNTSAAAAIALLIPSAGVLLYGLVRNHQSHTSD